jgi:hypothetical protein
MQINDELVISTLVALMSMAALKITEYLIKKKQDGDKGETEAIKEWHDDVAEELASARAEIRQLKEDSDKYRALYHDLLAAEYERSKPRTELTRKGD